MKHRIQKALIVLAVALLLLGTLATTAYANLDSEPIDGIHGTTESNPGAGADHWWRQGWGRTLYPDFALSPPEGMDWRFDGYIIGMLYSVHRASAVDTDGPSSESVINSTTPDAYYRASFGGVTDNTGPYGTNTENTLDMLGIFANPPAGGWGPGDPAAAYPVEGRWYLHYRYFSTFRYSQRTHTVGFGIDTTPPRPVEGLRIRTGLTSSDVTTWQPLTRAHITWTPDEYDALAGVGYYEVLIDDKPIIPEKNTLPEQGRVYSAPWLPTPSSITVENMPPGSHKVSIVCVDRATNRSTATSGYYYSDPDTPTVTITAPTNGLLKETLFISAEASDAAGPPGVKFALDGANIATFTAPPYRFKPNLSAVTPGAHVLSATATDHLGRSVTTTMAVSTLGAVVLPNDGFIVSDDEGLNEPLTGEASTNPNDSENGSVFWRQGWGNSVNPQFTVRTPSPNVTDFGFVGGMVYVTDRTEETTINPALPDNYSRSSIGEGTTLDQTVDLKGVFAYPPLGGWPASTLGGETVPYEGYWYFHFLPFTTKGYVPQFTSTVKIGIDVTAPRAVAGVVASPSLNESLSGAWTSASRATVSWTPDRYDDLSGVAYYKILLDGQPVIPAEADDRQGRVYEVLGRTPSSVTIENMPAGKHKLSVVAVDRATNEGPAADTFFYSDPDTPTVAFGSFSRTVGTRPTFSVVTSDAAGIRQVVYRLDGTLLGTQTSSPFSISPSLSAFSSGTHTLTATASDYLGRAVTISTSIKLDKTPLSISSFSRSASIFYPIKRDDFGDNSTVKFRVNKPCSVTLTIRTSKGTTIRTLTKSAVTGKTNKIIWNGKWSKDGKAHTGKYSYQLSGKDSVGYTDKTGKLYVTIRDYQLKRTGGDSIRVVPR